jgi:hypothetical protein
MIPRQGRIFASHRQLFQDQESIIAALNAAMLHYKLTGEDSAIGLAIEKGIDTLTLNRHQDSLLFPILNGIITDIDNDYVECQVYKTPKQRQSGTHPTGGQQGFINTFMKIIHDEISNIHSLKELITFTAETIPEILLNEAPAMITQFMLTQANHTDENFSHSDYTPDEINTLLNYYIKQSPFIKLLTVIPDLNLSDNLAECQQKLANTIKLHGKNFQKNFILMPIIINDKHYALLSLYYKIDLSDPIIFYIDPRGVNMTDTILPLLRANKLFPTLKPENIVINNLNYTINPNNSGACIVELAKQLIEKGSLQNLTSFDISKIKKEHKHILLKLNTVTFLLCWNRLKNNITNQSKDSLTTSLGDLDKNLIMKILFHTENMVEYSGNKIKYNC